MLNVGDVLWVFDEKSYSVYEISEILCYNEYSYNVCFYSIQTNVIIGNHDQHFLIPALINYNNLVKIRHNQVTYYYTTSEKEAVKFIESHYNN